MRALITGGCGFLGLNLRQHLLDHGWEVEGTYRNCEFIGEKYGFHQLEIKDPEEVKRIVALTEPDVIFHFAGQAFVQESFRDPETTWNTNTGGTLNVLEAIKGTDTRIVLAGSGTEYGPSPMACHEDDLLRPSSPYGASKVAAGVLCRQYHAAHGTDAVIMRIFGTTGVGKKSDAIADFAQQIVATERKETEFVRVGNLDVSRDIQDVRNAVEAFRVIAEKGGAGHTYNVGGGIAHPIRDILNFMGQNAKARFVVIQDPAKVRIGDEPVHLGNNIRLRNLGWEPRISIQQTLLEVLDYHRARNIK